jgi:myo-inositol-1(or 4)-monophosphatase
LGAISGDMEFLIGVARGAGEILRAGFGTGMQVEHKGEIDLVTEYDHRSEEYILARLHEAFPGCRVLAEESGWSRDGGDCVWMVDPLDGTTNYAHGVPIFAVSIALVEDGRARLGVVYDPMRGECFHAERGKGAFLGDCRLHASATADLRQALLVTGFPYDAWTTKQNNLEYYGRFAVRSQGVRRLGSAALDLAYIAAGRFDGYWELRLAPWDVAAGGLLAEEAGAKVTAVLGDGPYLTEKPSILAANPALHEVMLRVLRREEQIRLDSRFRGNDTRSE